MQEGAERGAAGGKAAWKLHIIRQLRHRDRSQHGAFLELIQSYNKLLEQSVFLKDLTEKIQTDPVVSPAGRHAARVPAWVLGTAVAPGTAGSEAPPTLQIAELQDYNGELAFQACELKKKAQKRDEELRQQRSSVSFLSALAEDHRRQCQCLESEVAQMVCANADLKEDYDRLLAQRRLVEGRLHIVEEQGRELLEELTKKKALEAERQNNFNDRRRGEMSRMVKTALCKTLSAEGDFSSWRNTDEHDTKSLEMTGSLKIEKPAPKKSRSHCCVREVTLEEKVTSLFMEPEQTQLLSCSRDDVLSLIDLRMGSVRLMFSPDASYSMAGSSDGTIFIWSTRTGVLERSLTGEHSVAVNAVAWSVSGDYVVSVDRGKKAVLWSEY